MDLDVGLWDKTLGYRPSLFTVIRHDKHVVSNCQVACWTSGLLMVLLTVLIVMVKHHSTAKNPTL